MRALGQGACGKTVLLYDEQIDEYVVCKKYVPLNEARRQDLFKNFLKEIKLLHQISHENIVRVFNSFIYPDQYAGYILMEFIEGAEIDKFISASPEKTNDVFVQSILGFNYLEQRSILHRDIRPGNIMVRNDGCVKIIDLGFGKKVRSSTDYDKSITLNWWCEPPEEFEQACYDFATEVYFVGRLFEKIIRERRVSHFKYTHLLEQMCLRNPALRTRSFADVAKAIGSNQFHEIDFSTKELATYRRFSNAVCGIVIKIENNTKYVDDIARIVSELNDTYTRSMMEESFPQPVTVLRCLLDGDYYFRNKVELPVPIVREFVELLRTCSEAKARVIVANLHAKMDAIPRYAADQIVPNEEIPF